MTGMLAASSRAMSGLRLRDGVSAQAEIKLLLAELERDALRERGGTRIGEAGRALVAQRRRLDGAAIADDLVYAIDHVILRKIRPRRPSASGRDYLLGRLAHVARPWAQVGYPDDPFISGARAASGSRPERRRAAAGDLGADRSVGHMIMEAEAVASALGSG